MKRSWLCALLQLALSAALLLIVVWLVWPWPYRDIPAASFFPTLTATSTWRLATHTRVPTGTQLIPTETPVPVVHVVQPGEVLGVIAKLYGVSAESIMAANGIKDADLLQRGQKLVIPDPRQTPRATAVQHDATPSATPTSPFREQAPVLLSPAEGALFEGRNAVVVLAWASTAALGDSEYYRVRFWCSGQSEDSAELFYTTTSGWIIPQSLYPEEGDGLCNWSVAVVYHARRDIALSPASEARTFTWR
jgi:LysM repeat protein